MTTVTGLTADRMLAIEAASVVDGDVDDNGNLILTKHDGSKINAGSVIGPAGPRGPVGQDTSVVASRAILDVGLLNQIRAGRQLSPADFGNLGLSAPIGLWNLSDLTDASGNGRNLLNKGAVPFAAGINGAANTAAQFVGNTGQALYISDTGANDPFRIKTGSIGCWFKTAKRGVQQEIVTKCVTASGNFGFFIYVNSSNVSGLFISSDGANSYIVNGVSDLCDDRWHFMVGTIDGSMLKLYVDGILEGSISAPPVFSAAAPLNIGTRGADSSTSGTNPHFGRVDEVFVTADVLSEDQIRNLYCAKIAHTLGAAPIRVSLNVRRRKKGAALVVADFPTQPLRLHNFSAGSLGDEGSNNVGLTNNGAAVPVAGVDGSLGNAFSFNGSQTLSSTDAGLPATIARSYGHWFKTTATANQVSFAWGSGANGDRILIGSNVIQIYNVSNQIAGSMVVIDGMWHFVVVVEDPGAIDGLKLKLYIDGRLNAVGTALSNVTLGGANNFIISSSPAGFNGQIDGVFICGYALTPEQILALYAKGSQALAASPKNSGDHIEAMDATNLYTIFDTLESQHQVDLAVA